MTRHLVLLATGVIWAVMTAGLVRREVLPYFAFQAPPTYRSLLTARKGWEVETADISFSGTPCGTIETLFDPEYGDGSRTLTILRFSARARISKQEVPLEFPVTACTETDLTPNFELDRFTWSMSMGPVGLYAIGKRKDDLLTIEYRVSSTLGVAFNDEGKKELEFPRDTMLGDAFQPYGGGGKMFIGKRWKMTSITPDLAGFRPTLRLGLLYAVVTARETFAWRGRPIQGFKIEVRRKATEDDLPTHVFYVNDAGAALLQKMTFQNLEYVIELRDRRELSATELHAWTRRWTAAATLPGAPKKREDE